MWCGYSLRICIVHGLFSISFTLEQQEAATRHASREVSVGGREFVFPLSTANHLHSCIEIHVASTGSLAHVRFKGYSENGALVSNLSHFSVYPGDIYIYNTSVNLFGRGANMCSAWLLSSANVRVYVMYASTWRFRQHNTYQSRKSVHLMAVMSTDFLGRRYRLPRKAFYHRVFVFDLASRTTVSYSQNDDIVRHYTHHRSGSLIIAEKPVAVFLVIDDGHATPCQSIQISPVERWGKEFIVKLWNDSVELYVTSDVNDTAVHVQFDADTDRTFTVHPATRSDVIYQPSASYAYMSASFPVQVLYYFTSQYNDVLVQPTIQWSKNYRFLVQYGNISLVVVIKAKYAQGLYCDTENVAGYLKPVGSSPYVTGMVPVKRGRHHVFHVSQDVTFDAWLSAPATETRDAFMWPLDVGGNQSNDAPYITSIFPLFGPVAGETLVEITGQYLDELSEVRIGNELCKFASNMTFANFFTPPAEKSGTKELKLHFRNRWQMAPYTFTYKSNPVISSIFPDEAYLEGGISITVTGQSFDAVSCASMVTTVTCSRNDKELGKLQTVCKVDSSETMTCPTAHIPKKWITSCLNSTVTRKDVHRNRRSPEIIKTVVRFVLNGIDNFTGNFDLYQRTRPVFDPKQVIVYKPRASGREFIDIPVKDMGMKWENQTLVAIGNFSCNVTSVKINLITCKPPTEEFVNYTDPGFFLKKHSITVTIGDDINVAGTLIWDLSGPWFESAAFRAIYGILIVLAIASGLAVAARLCWTKHDLRYLLAIRGPKNDKDDTDGVDGEDICEMPSFLDTDLQSKVRRMFIESCRLTLGPVVGQGHFGYILQGELMDEKKQNWEKVAVKSIKGNCEPTEEDLEEFLNEATLTMDLQHVNVLSTKGIVLKDTKPYVVLPYMGNGDLKTYISDPNNLLVVRQLVEFGLQVACGMEYLESQHFVHRDLAARNCMVGNDLVIKVADFGLSRDVYEKEYYRISNEQRPLPVKWMAIESLKSGTFSSKSDVWSFGVLLWELATRGAEPYDNVSNFQIRDHISTGRRLPKPDYSPSRLYTLMTDCWQEDPDRRPCFQSIISRLSMINSKPSIKCRREREYFNVPLSRRKEVTVTSTSV